MFYEFPVIEHIDDVKAAIKDQKEFIVVERDWGYVVNYIINMASTFDVSAENYENDIIKRECRGIKFDKEGKILARPYHKFFNYGEKPETYNHSLKDHLIFEKLDGSMVHPILTDKEKRHWRLCTKMGITEVSMQAENWITENHKTNYVNFILDAICDHPLTPIFEWCSRQNRIVIDYPKDRLVLTAIRDNVTGEYYSYEDLNFIAEKYDLDLVNVQFPNLDHNLTNIKGLTEYTKDLKDVEGFVVRYDNGHMIKIKADEYVSIHRVKADIMSEKNVIPILLSDKFDDVISMLPEGDRKNLIDFNLKFWQGIFGNVVRFGKSYEDFYKETNGDRKTFAIKYAKEIEKEEPYLKAYLFLRWGKDFSDQDTLNFITSTILRKCGSNAGVNEVRHLWNNHVYSINNSGVEDAE